MHAQILQLRFIRTLPSSVERKFAEDLRHDELRYGGADAQEETGVVETQHRVVESRVHAERLCRVRQLDTLHEPEQLSICGSNQGRLAQ